MPAAGLAVVSLSVRYAPVPKIVGWNCAAGVLISPVSTSPLWVLVTPHSLLIIGGCRLWGWSSGLKSKGNECAAGSSMPIFAIEALSGEVLRTGCRRAGGLLTPPLQVFAAWPAGWMGQSRPSGTV